MSRWKIIILTILTFCALYLGILRIFGTDSPKIKLKNEPLIGQTTQVHASWSSIHGDRKRKQLAFFFNDLHSKLGLNANVLVAQKGNILYESSLGYADRANKEPLTPNTLFQIASVSKQFTAVAALQLVQAGKLKLDERVCRILPGFPYPNVTVEQLMCHRSGLCNYMYFCDKVCDRRSFLDNQTMLNLINRYKPAPYLPAGQRFDYSNTGFAILALVVEKVSGMNFPIYCQKHLFGPAGMDSTFIYQPQKQKNIPGKAQGYEPNGRQSEDSYLDGVYGDKGICTTVRDLYRWDQALYSDIILDDNYKSLAFQIQNPDMKPTENYGFGFRIREFEDGKKVVYHAGWWHGFHALFMRLLHNQSTIIILSNRVSWSIKRIDELQEILNQD